VRGLLRETEISEVMAPSATATNLSALAAPTPTPTPTQACSIVISDQTVGVPNASSSGTVACAVAAKHQLALTLVSPFASNTVTVNSAVPNGWSALAPGLIATVIPDAVGEWTLEVTTPGAAPNSVTIQGY